MIGQYLPNNNEKRYSAILPKISDLNRPYGHAANPWTDEQRWCMHAQLIYSIPSQVATVVQRASACPAALNANAPSASLTPTLSSIPAASSGLLTPTIPCQRRGGGPDECATELKPSTVSAGVWCMDHIHSSYPQAKRSIWGRSIPSQSIGPNNNKEH
jgi:hypothetical protein